MANPRTKITIPSPDNPKFWEVDVADLYAALIADGALTDSQRVGHEGPQAAEYAVVGQSPGPDEGKAERLFYGYTGTLFRDWLRNVGIDPEACFYTNVCDLVLSPGATVPDREVKVGAIRVARELSQLPNLRVVILVGGPATSLALKGNMSQKHGQRSTLFATDTTDLATRKKTGWPCIGMYHPSFVARQKDPQRKLELVGSCLAVLARAKNLDKPVALPPATVVSSPGDGWPQSIVSTYGAAPNVVSGTIGLDTETHGVEHLREAMRLRANRPDARASTLDITGMADGRVFEGVPDFAPDAAPIAHNLPFDAVAIDRPDLAWHDSKVVAHLVGERDTEMKSLALRVLGRRMISFTDAGGHVNYADMTDEQRQKFRQYCVQDAQAHQGLFETLYGRASPNVRRLYDTVERPMLPIYCRWTMEGVFSVDHERLAAKLQQYDGEIASLRDEICARLGITNPNAPLQIQRAFNLKSADVAALTKLAERGIKEAGMVLRYRTLMKRRGTYLLTWQRWPFERLSTKWRPTGTGTGRPSSADLNLQNIPADLADCLLFPGYAADARQLEVRIAAHYYQEKRLIDLFKMGGDIYDNLGQIMRVSDRRYRKVGVLACLYGGDEDSISVQAARFGIPQHEIAPVAKQLVDEMHRAFPDLFANMRKVQNAEVVPGLFGREHRVPPGTDIMHQRRERVNWPCQGGGVDVMKLVTLRCEKAGLKTWHMIHDEDYITTGRDPATLTPKQLADEKQQVREVMESAVRMSVPIEFDVKTWEEKRAKVTR